MSDTVVPQITREQNDSKGRYMAAVAGIQELAELTYSVVNEQLIIADHTGVPETMRGMGVGRALVEHLVKDARSQDFRIIPLCPYVKAQLQKHPEWADVFQS